MEGEVVQQPKALAIEFVNRESLAQYALATLDDFRKKRLGGNEARTIFQGLKVVLSFDRTIQTSGRELQFRPLKKQEAA